MTAGSRCNNSFGRMHSEPKDLVLGVNPFNHRDASLFRQSSIPHARQIGRNKTITEACSEKETLAIAQEIRL
ncbi:MAG: hypothetical protein DWI22_04150 [Planctomycetota bacterium]|nr:MAG: hypothetical protein DWI22_04150 [Planctomycetota bacterium]